MESKKSDFLSFWFYPPTPSKGVGVLLVRKFSESFRMFRKKFGMIRNFPKVSENLSGKCGNFPNRAEIFRKNEHIFRMSGKDRRNKTFFPKIFRMFGNVRNGLGNPGTP